MLQTGSSRLEEMQIRRPLGTSSRKACRSQNLPGRCREGRHFLCRLWLMRISRHVLPAFLVALAISFSASAGNIVVVESVANRLILGDSSAVEMVGRLSGEPGRAVYQSAFFRIRGRVYSVAASDERCGILELRVSSGKTELQVQADWRFASDHLPVPQSVTISGETHRFFWAEKPIAPEARHRAAVAVQKLPVDFLEALKLMISLEGADVEGYPYALSHATPLFEDSIPGATVLDKTPLTPQEAEGLAREAGVKTGM